MLGKMNAWVQANRYRLNETGLTFALVWVWVTLVLMSLNLYAIKTGAVGTDIMPHLHDELLPYPLKALFAGTSLSGSFLWAFAGACVMAPLMEEYCRGAVCQFCTDRTSGLMKNPFILNSLSGIGFGLLHGGGYFSVLVQGALGFMLGRLWFKNVKNPDGTSSTAWAYWSNVAVHAAYNFCVLGTELLVLRTHL
ncbi:MAG TPA: CPBP family glutamic-type intramembrane protease [Candidatus Baltobacteraceae bacterium]|nr:CPBP family glutamic-type intramembrane protease [Candidatus Baltobacteraceae bacterium]